MYILNITQIGRQHDAFKFSKIFETIQNRMLDLIAILTIISLQ